MKKDNVSKHNEIEHKQYAEKIYESILKHLNEIQKESQEWIGMNSDRFRNIERRK